MILLNWLKPQGPLQIKRIQFLSMSYFCECNPDFCDMSLNFVNLI